MRERIASLKSTVHEEKIRAAELHREKVSEIRELRDFAEVRVVPNVLCGFARHKHHRDGSSLPPFPIAVSLSLLCHQLRFVEASTYN